MDTWIHCGKCYQLVNSQIKMYLANCGSFVCDNCRRLPAPCSCGSTNCQTVALNNKMPKNVQNLLVDPDEHLKTMAKTIDFQNRQRANYLAYCRTEYMKILYEATQAKNRLEELDREVDEKTVR